MAYPTRLLTDDEEIIREFHPHWRVLLMAMTWALVGVALSVVAVTARRPGSRSAPACWSCSRWPSRRWCRGGSGSTSSRPSGSWSGTG